MQIAVEIALLGVRFLLPHSTFLSVPLPLLFLLSRGLSENHEPLVQKHLAGVPWQKAVPLVVMGMFYPRKRDLRDPLVQHCHFTDETET